MKELSLLLKREPSLREKGLLTMARRGMTRHGFKELEPMEVIKRAIESHGDSLTLGWSGGRCSTIVLHMALQINPKIQVIFNNTGVEFPENVKYVHEVTKTWNLNFKELKPKENFFRDIQPKYGFPQMRSKTFGKLTDKKRKLMKNCHDKRPMCCFLLKEKPRYRFYRAYAITGDINGLRACESRVRAIFIGQRGQIYSIKKPRPMMVYCPIALWSSPQCEVYIQENNIPFNETYKTQTRNGCWPCTAYKSWKENLLRYNPRMYRLVQNLQGVQLLDNYQQEWIPNQVPCEPA